MAVRLRWTMLVPMIALSGLPRASAAPVGNISEAVGESQVSAICKRGSAQQLADAEPFLDLILKKLDLVGDVQAAELGRVDTKSIQLAISTGCLDLAEQGFMQLRQRELGSGDAAYEVWKLASEALSNLVRAQAVPERVEAVDFAAAKEASDRWHRPPAEVAAFYLSAMGAYRGAGYRQNNVTAFDRALEIARDHILPIADPESMPELWFQLQFFIGDTYYAKINAPQPGETPDGLAQNAIDALEAALALDLPDDVTHFLARLDRALTYAFINARNGFADLSLNDQSATAIGEVLSDRRLTPDSPWWGYLYDAYAKAGITSGTLREGPERARRIADALAKVEQGLAQMDRDRDPLAWAKLQIDHAVAGRELALSLTEKEEMLRNIDVALAAYESILAAEAQLAEHGGKDLLALAQSRHRDTKNLRDEIAAGQ